MVFRHIRWLVAVRLAFQIQQISAGPSGEGSSHHAVRSAPSVHDANRRGVDVDLHTEVGAALANGPPSDSKASLRPPRRRHDDVVAAPAYQLVQPEIVEVAAIAQVDECGCAPWSGRAARRSDTSTQEPGPDTGWAAPARIAQPPSRAGRQTRSGRNASIPRCGIPCSVRRRPRDRYRRPHLRTIRMAVSQGGNIPARLESPRSA